MSADEVRGVLAAYKTVMEASWPSLHPAMNARAAQWPAAGEAALQSELRDYLRRWVGAAIGPSEVTTSGARTRTSHRR